MDFSSHAFRTESLFKIKNVPLVYYRFKYDSVSDRSQMGVLGLDAQKYLALKYHRFILVIIKCLFQMVPGKY